MYYIIHTKQQDRQWKKYNLFIELEDFIMINQQKHYTKYLHDKLETKDIRCI